MAIVIPSKHIYDKDNNKIRDNKIDRVEVNATEITPDNKYETNVYNEKIIIENYSTYSEKNTSSDVRGFFKNSWTFTYGVGVSKTQITRMYCSGTIKIPKLKNNTLIEKILSKKDNEGNARIKYSSRCTKKTGTVSKNEVLTESIYNPDSGAIRVEVSITNNTIENNDRTFTSEKLGEVLPDTLIYEDTISFNQKYTVLDTEYSVTSKTTYPDNLTNLGSLDVTYNEENEEYQFEYVLLCGIGFDKLGAKKEEDYTIGEDTKDFTLTKNISLSGETEFYFPDQVEITVYGNTIGIDLTDKTVYIPDESGNKPFSIEGNELMQTSNYNTSKEFLLKEVDNYVLISPTSYYVGKSTDKTKYYHYTSVHIGGEKNSWETYVKYKDTKYGFTKTVIIPPRQKTHSPALETTGTDTIEIIKVYNKNSICSQFQDTLLEYSNGKETATILCDVGDYYDTEGNQIIYKSGISKSNISFTWDEFISADITQDYYRSYITLTKGNIKQSDIIKTINGYIKFEADANVGDKCWCQIYGEAEYAENIFESGSATIERVEQMTFSMYNKVIPMVYGANGVDKPMSKYKDGTPKKFKVLGTRIFYDGAVWQELTLQETLE